MVAVPQKATTVILLREDHSKGFEVFLLKRHEKSSFMAGNYVYPGGRVDREDHNVEISPFCKGISREKAHQVLGGMSSTEEDFAYWIAGIRELYEEAGVLLAYDQEGNPFALKNQEEEERFSNYRNLLQKGKITLRHLAEQEHLFLALDQLHHYAHWITPEARPQRFDTYFYVARHPFGQKAIHDRRETTAGIWITPKDALKENLTGEVILSPPTLKTLEDLSRFKTIDEVLKSLKSREIPTILPVLTKVSGEHCIVFPWDPEYEGFQRGNIPDPINHGRPPRPEDTTTRLIFQKDRWHPYCKPRL